jgi:RNA polymerase sigma-70 factor (ECF subfamily)
MEVNSSPREEEWTILMRAAVAGDAHAYRQFLLLVTPSLRAMARSHQRRFNVSDADIEDVVQEVLLTVHLKRGTWHSSRPIGPWLAAIVRNKLIDIIRRRGRSVHVPIEDVIDTLQAEEPFGSHETQDIDRLLRNLRPRQQHIVRSISLNGCSIRETASRLGMTEGGVRVALHRALKALAALYRADPI